VFVWSTGSIGRFLFGLATGFAGFWSSVEPQQPQQAQAEVELPTYFYHNSVQITSPLTLNTDMLRLIYDGQQELRHEVREVKGQSTRLETKMEVVEAQNARLEAEVGNLKRRLEEKAVEEKNKKLCTEYPYLKLRTRLTRRPTGVRATIYELADRHNALQYTKEAVFYAEENGTLLNVNLYFPTVTDASRFL
jgi:regulator of replication initiation timing